MKNMKDMIPEGIVVRNRGINTVEIPFGKYTVVVQVKVLTNKEVDELTMEHVSYETGDPVVDGAALTQIAIRDGLVDINTTFRGKKYKDLEEIEKDEFLDKMDYKLRDAIAKAVMGANHLTATERDFL